MAGSSPLARGLRAVVSARQVRVRIIPARAEFTYRCPHDRCPDRDHPRSRGVYSVCCVIAWTFVGSSPLARGLPPAVRGHPRDRRIIPARAGFT